MNEIYFNQCILCNVKTCKYNNLKNYCTLGKIIVDKKNGTNCASFENKN